MDSTQKQLMVIKVMQRLEMSPEEVVALCQISICSLRTIKNE